MGEIQIDYDVVCADCVKKLREIIRQKLSENWVTDGDIIKEFDCQGKNVWHQKIIKYKKGAVP